MYLLFVGTRTHPIDGGVHPPATHHPPPYSYQRTTSVNKCRRGTHQETQRARNCPAQRGLALHSPAEGPRLPIVYLRLTGQPATLVHPYPGGLSESTSNQEELYAHFPHDQDLTLPMEVLTRPPPTIHRPVATKTSVNRLKGRTKVDSPEKRSCAQYCTSWAAMPPATWAGRNSLLASQEVCPDHLFTSVSLGNSPGIVST